MARVAANSPGKTSGKKKRMSGPERREQLVAVGRGLFAAKGLEGTSMEEIAAQAGVTKPVVYEHFPQKELLYAEVVRRESAVLSAALNEAIAAGSSRYRIERSALALLTFVEEHPDGFRIIVRDAPLEGEGTFATLLSVMVEKASVFLSAAFMHAGLNPVNAPLYAQALVGMVSQTAQWWMDVRRPSKEQVAAHIVNLCWNGLTGMEDAPTLHLVATEGGLGAAHVALTHPEGESA
ncbi:MAG: TetR/AcrR family transcriptional regulator [Corynebacterium sp.]|nr:TetR/AcrR family transcriptional regulator [Corynebacterium sp.]